MTWRAYQVVLQLRSPLHIGAGKVGNLQRTRHYVTGRVLWGALTARLGRDAAQGRGPATDSRQYREVGQQIHESLGLVYFYPALKSENSYAVAWPWEDPKTFRRRFLSSYQGTALSYPHHSADEGMLHEVEFISPNTLDTGESVFLTGYVFERSGCTLSWRAAFSRLQLGGERGYGWGDVDLVDIRERGHEDLFGNGSTFDGKGGFPIVNVPNQGHLLAHTLADHCPSTGEVEPLVGREWRSDAPSHRYVGQHVAFNGVCFKPGSVVQAALSFRVEKYGMWQSLEAASDKRSKI